MARNYVNLGNVYQTRGDLDKALEFHQKSLKINESLGSKAGMASNYGNLANVYKQQGNKAQAKRYRQMSIKLFNALGSPKAQLVQGGLNVLE